MISIRGLDKAAALAALYNAAAPAGMGWLHHKPDPMTRDEAAAILAGGGRPYFDYLKGRAMKVDLGRDDEFDERLYDRDNGNGAAETAIAPLRVDGPFTDEDADPYAHTPGLRSIARAALKRDSNV